MKRYILILAAFALALSSCSLEEHPKYFTNSEFFYKTEAQCTAAVKGCYTPINSIHHANYMIAIEGCTDIWYSTSSTVDSALEVSPAKAQFANTMWPNCYKGIMYCNEVIDCIGATDATDLTEESRNKLIAEAKVLRAYYYYMLTCFFGDVPFYTNRLSSIADMEAVRLLPRRPANEIRQILYEDLTEAQNWLPQQRTNKDPENRAGAAFGYMLMAKFMIWNENWEECLIPLKKLEELYGDFTEENFPLEQIMWRYKNTNESIFEVQHEYSFEGIKYYQNMACIMMPPHNGDGIFDKVPLEGYGTTMPGWNSLRANNVYAIFRPAACKEGDTATGYKEKSSEMNSIFRPVPLTYSTKYFQSQGNYYTEIDSTAVRTGMKDGVVIDRRVFIKLGWGNLETFQAFDFVHQWGVPWPGPQFWCPNITNTYDSNNYRIFRYADAILMLAECYCKLEDDVNALYYLNKIRQRAGVGDYPTFTGFEDLIVELRAERARELGGELQRKYDLVRWGIWYDQTYKCTKNGTMKANMRPCHRYYPIPDVECSLSKGALSNPEYDEFY